MSCQTDVSSFEEPKASDAELKLSATVVEYENLRKKYMEIETALIKSEEEVVKLKDEMEYSRKHTKHIEEELIKAQSAPKFHPVAVPSPEKTSVTENESISPLLSFTNVLRDFEAVKSNAAIDSAAVSTALHGFGNDMFEESKRIMLAINKLAKLNKSAQDEVSSTKIDLMVAKEAFRQEQVELKAALANIESLKDKLEIHSKAAEIGPLPSRESQGCDPLSPMADRNRREMDAAERQKLLENKVSNYEDLLLRVDQAIIQIKEVQKRHNDDMQTAKHLAHVKDLGRVAAIREMSIEKDKLISELKLNKDIHSILTFALNTCEQTLNDVQPHVVTKLQEGRNKRLKALEHAHRQQKKDLDQRSMDTCLVSTAHLEGFVIKAEKKHKESTDKAANALRKLRDLLDLSVAHNNDTNDVNNEEEKLGDRGKEEALEGGKGIVE